jgi:heat shock protein HtpX
MYSEIDANKRKSAFLIFGFFVLVAVIAYFVSYFLHNFSIAVIAVLFAAGYALWSYYGSDKLALSMNKAQEIQKSDNPRLWRIVENLTIATGQPMPKVYIINDPALNAFATGRSPEKSSVAVTSGLLEVMNDNELNGVIAHELGHIKNYDIRLAMVVFGLVAAVSIISDVVLRGMFWGSFSDDDSGGGGNSNAFVMVLGIIGLILAPIVATIIQLAISRKREYLADATSALTTRYPEGLASALQKIQNGSSVMRKQNPSSAHLFFASPLKGRSLLTLFSTHPPVEDRIARLRKMETKA